MSTEFSTPQQTLLDAARDPLLVHALYQTYQNHTDAFAPNLQSVAPSGAIGRNAEWEAGNFEKWFVEQQRYGTELIQAGLVLENDAWVQQGWAGLRWAFTQQDEETGAFVGTSDAFHSTSIFVEAASRSLLQLRQSGRADYAQIADEYAPQILSAAHWLNLPQNSQPVLDVEVRYTHRMYILASALGTSAALTGDKALRASAASWAEKGLELQRPDGVNPEKGGFDTNYQQAGCLLACRYYLACDDAGLRERIAAMLGRALTWERNQTDENGVISTEGSLRVGQEKGRSGTVKTINYKEALFAFVHGAQITGDAALHQTAERIAGRADWLTILSALYPFQPD